MEKPKGRQGFASMPIEKVKEIASKGGSSVPKEKRRFSNPEFASIAGKKGGTTTGINRKKSKVNL